MIKQASFIKKVWITLFLMLLLRSLVFADDGRTVIMEVRDIISSQIDAFRKNDVKKAYTFAAPNIQSQYPNPEVFGFMVRNGYPVIWRPKSFKFTEFKDFGDRCIQRVLFQSYNGSLESYDYILEKNGDFWRIAGVLAGKSAGET
jgi:hypothetical protein